MSQVLGVFGLLDFTMLRPVLALCAFLNFVSLIFQIFSQSMANRGYSGPHVYRFCAQSTLN